MTAIRYRLKLRYEHSVVDTCTTCISCIYIVDNSCFPYCIRCFIVSTAHWLYSFYSSNKHDISIVFIIVYHMYIPLFPFIGIRLKIALQRTHFVIVGVLLFCFLNIIVIFVYVLDLFSFLFVVFYICIFFYIFFFIFFCGWGVFFCYNYSEAHIHINMAVDKSYCSVLQHISSSGPVCANRTCPIKSYCRSNTSCTCLRGFQVLYTHL